MHLEDAVLSGLLTVHGIEASQADRLLAGLHEQILPVIQGRPGSWIEGGAVILVQELPPETSHVWPKPELLLEEGQALRQALRGRVRV